MKIIYNNRIAKMFFKRYFGIEKEVFKITKTSIHYWTDKEKREAQCREYGKEIFDIPIIKKIKYVAIIALLFLKNPIVFFFLLTDNSSVDNKGHFIQFDNPTTPVSVLTYELVGHYTGTTIRRILHEFALSAGSGSISKIELYLYSEGGYGGTNDIEVHTLTRDFVEAEICWSYYSGSNLWTLAGGDFDANVIDTVNIDCGDASGFWVNWVLLGIGAENPITATWGDTIRLLLKFPSEVATGNLGWFVSKRGTAGQRPYILITYSAVSGPTNLKTLNSNVASNIKTINTNAIANTKSLNTNT